MNLTANEVVQRAKVLAETTDSPIYLQDWGAVEAGCYAGRGNPNGLRLKGSEPFTEADWDRAKIIAQRYINKE